VASTRSSTNAERAPKIELFKIQMEQCQMPPVVHLEKAVAGPVRQALAHPGDAFARAVLHFQHMGHRMLRPTVAGLQVDSAATGPFGGQVIGVFFQAKRVHAEQRVVARHVRPPFRQGATNAVTQHAPVTAKEIQQVAGLQGEDILRPDDAHIFQAHAGLLPAPLQQRADGLEVALLARVVRQSSSLSIGLTRRSQTLGLGAQQVQPGPQNMGHDHFRSPPMGGVEAGQWVADVTLELFQGLLIVVQAVLIGTGNFQAQRIAHRHGMILVWL
jgi:hypothetical protein